MRVKTALLGDFVNRLRGAAKQGCRRPDAVLNEVLNRGERGEFFKLFHKIIFIDEKFIC